MIFKKIIRYFLLLIFFSFFYFSVHNLSSNNGLKADEFSCTGIYKTFINKYPLEVIINNNKLSWNIIIPNDDDFSSLTKIWNGDISIEELKDLFIGPSIITVFYSKRENIELNVNYSDGIFVEIIDENIISIKWLWIEGTFIKNDCQLEMPIEVDSVEKFIEFYPL